MLSHCHIGILLDQYNGTLIQINLAAEIRCFIIRRRSLVSFICSCGYDHNLVWFNNEIHQRKVGLDSRSSAKYRSDMLIKLLITCMLFLALLWPTSTKAQSENKSQTAVVKRDLTYHLVNTPELLGDRGGTRKDLEDLGLTLELFYNQFLGLNAFGGLKNNTAVKNSGSYDFFAFMNLEELGVIPNNTVLLHVKGNYGQNVNPNVGAFSDPFDDADFDEPIYIAQFWSQQTWLENRVRLRLGYLDQSTMLDRNAYANSEDIQFMSAALDNNPLIPLKVGLGITLLINPVSWLDLVFGTADADNKSRNLGFDTAFDDLESLMGYFELTTRVQWDSVQGSLPGTFRVGVFLDATKRSDSERSRDGTPSRSRRDHPGVYLSLDQQLFRESAGSVQGLGFFARYGYASKEVSPITQFGSFGFQYNGLLPGRNQDVMGLGLYMAFPSNRFQNTTAMDLNAEIGIEYYYNVQMLPWLTITPDLQLIVNPRGISSVPNALIAGLRFRVAL